MVYYPPSQGPVDVEAGLVGWGGLSTGARVSPGQEAFILWYQVGEQSPVVVGGSVVVGGAVREGQVLSGIATYEASPPPHPSPASFSVSFVGLAGRVGVQSRCHGQAGVMPMCRAGFLRKSPLCIQVPWLVWATLP